MPPLGEPEILGGDEGEEPRVTSPWPRRAVVAVLAVVAVVVAGPQLLSTSGATGLLDAPAPPPSATPSPATPSPSPTPLAVLWRLRGDLADDAAFTRRVESGTRGGEWVRPLWQGRVTGGRAAIVAARREHNSGPTAEAVWFPDKAQEQPSRQVIGPLRRLDDAIAWLSPPHDGWLGVAPAGRRTLVVLGPRAPLSALVSDGVTYPPDGTATRDWRRLDVVDGFAATEVAGGLGGTAVRIGGRPGEVVVPHEVAVGGLALTLEPPPRPSPAGSLSPGEVREAITGPLSGLGTEPARARTVWNGRLGERVRAAVVAVDYVGGPVLQVLVAATREGVVFVEPRPVPRASGGLGPVVLPAECCGGQPSRAYVIDPGGGRRADLLRNGRTILSVPLNAQGYSDLSAGLFLSSLQVRVDRGGGDVVTVPARRPVDGDFLALAPLPVTG